MTIAIKPSHKGLLHKKLGIKQGKQIPLRDLMRAKRAPSASEREEANFAINARHWGGR